jgi:hypothetical protein
MRLRGNDVCFDLGGSDYVIVYLNVHTSFMEKSWNNLRCTRLINISSGITALVLQTNWDINTAIHDRLLEPT